MKTIPILLALFVCGCSSSLDRQLDQIDLMMNDHPAEALSSLDSIDHTQIRSQRLRARYALLHSIALDKNYIDLKSDSVISPAVQWYSRHGSPYEKARTYYYKGRIDYHSKDYASATINYIKAESLFPKFDDDYLNRLILLALVITNNDNFFYEENIDLLRRATEYLPPNDSSEQRYYIDLSLATYYNNTHHCAQADSVYSAIEASIDQNSTLYRLCLRNHARLLINGDNVDPGRSYLLFQAALSRGAKLYPEDALAYAVAAYSQGHKDEALSIVDQVDAAGGYEAQVANTRYRIAIKEGNLADALEYQRQTSILQDSIISSTLKQSVVKAQRDYFEESSARALERSRYQRNIIWLLVALFSLVFLAGYALVSRRKTKHEAEISRLSDILLQTEALLKQTEEEKEDYKAKFITKFKGQFVTLRKMVEDYLKTQGRSDQKDYVFRKVEGMAKLVSDDKEGNRMFEKQLNEELGSIMDHFREDIPGKDESTYRFVSYLIAGFDPPVISLLMGYSIGFIYKKKSRLVTEVSQIQSAYKGQYLDFLR